MAEARSLAHIKLDNAYKFGAGRYLQEAGALNLLGGDAKADGDDIVLHGVKQLRGGITLPNYGDHRMVMLASIAATKCEQPIEMDGIEAIDKSWPEYLKVYQMLGGKCE